METKKIIEKCCKMDPKAQEELYRKFYSYGMSIALRYSNSREDAVEILNDSFLKVFKNIDLFSIEKKFKVWFRRILINTSIDKFRSKKKITDYSFDDIQEKKYVQLNESILNKLLVEDVIRVIQELPEVYKLTFNLYEIEGYSHEEISKKLNINETTSRSNLSRAKQKLRMLLKERFNYERAG